MAQQNNRNFIDTSRANWSDWRPQLTPLPKAIMSRLRNRQVCRTASCLVAAFLLSFTLLRPISAGAATQWWDTSAAGAPGDGLQAGNGNWSTTGGGTNLRWSTASTGTALTNWVNGNDAIFQTSGTSLVTLNSAGMTVNSMTFNG